MAAPRLGPEKGRALRSLGALSAVGLSFVLAVIIGTALGYVLDRWLGTSPWLFLLCFFLGLAAGMRTVFRTVAAVSKQDE
jgi:ATP synthase protein I